ncbi:ParB/RepB/Spo0J family partition protein [Sulfitobacter sp.]|uniref:ParB/RepB/Spo0J family partition protein n=1 Tax=Sulfitobacter sp. TaxID=1903071 RepID=UPI003002E890
MAKRKRLTLADPAHLHQPASTGVGGFSFGAAAPIAGVVGDAAASAAFDEMSETLTRAREDGRMVLSLPLGEIALDHLVRDRVAMTEPELDALMQSIKARGQQTPIEVMDLGDGRYGLISGWRRCQALKRLAQEAGEERFGSVLALLRRPDQATDAYLAMVEENEIRVGLSFYERARIVAKSVEQGVFDTEKTALQALFSTASRSKRSKIGSFIRIVHALDGVLRYPEALSERTGLALVKALDEGWLDPAAVQAALRGVDATDVDAEQAVLAAALLRKSKADKILQKVSNQKLETDKSEDLTAEGGRELAPGVWLHSHPNGSLVLQGAGLTPEFRSALRVWLTSQN